MAQPSSWKSRMLRLPLAGKTVQYFMSQGHPQEEAEVGGLVVAGLWVFLAIVAFNSFLFGFLRAFFGGIFDSLMADPFEATVVGLLVTLLILALWFKAMGKKEAETKAVARQDFRDKERLKEKIAAVQRGAMGHFQEALTETLRQSHPQIALKRVNVTDTNPRIQFMARKKTAESGGRVDQAYMIFRERLFEDVRDILSAAFEVAPNARIVTVDGLLNFINKKAQYYDGPVVSLRAERQLWTNLDLTQPDAFRCLSPLEIAYHDGMEVQPLPELESQSHKVLEKLRANMNKVDIQYGKTTTVSSNDDEFRNVAEPADLFITELDGGADLSTLGLKTFETVMVKLLKRHGLDVPKVHDFPGGLLEFRAYHLHPLLGGSLLVWAKQRNANSPMAAEMVAELDEKVREEGRARGLYFVTSGFTDEARNKARGQRVVLVDRQRFLELAKWHADPAMKVDLYGATQRRALDPTVDLSGCSVPVVQDIIEKLLGNLGFTISRINRLQGGAIKAVAVHNHPILGGKVAVLARQFPEKQPVGDEVVREFTQIMEAEFCSRGILFLSAYMTPAARKAARASGVDLVERNDWYNLLQTFKF